MSRRGKLVQTRSLHVLRTREGKRGDVLEEMMKLVLVDGTTIEVPMRNVLKAFAEDLRQAGNVSTRRMVEVNPGQIVEVTARMHEGRLPMQTTERRDA